ncbi:hypothetical protein L2E82_06043 [Cichorium intybus]|uniref:Uncharacterized protein n=1 Tax=Cichorium intybus TaxID=13427 RepID=A0ACB9H8Z0_CICIN|nr:hypothetical protein L2E82_06043 [Cichorium intybus]
MYTLMKRFFVHHQGAGEGKSVEVEVSPLIARVLEFSPSPQQPVQDENNVLLGKRIRKPPTPRFEQEFNQPPTNTKTQHRRKR